MTLQRCVLAVWRLLLALFLAVTAYYVIFHHVSPLSRDQWHMYDALFSQGLWRTSITTVSGHRHILAFLLYDIDLEFFGGKNHFLIAVDWLLNLGLIAVLSVQIQRCVPDVQSRHFLIGWTILLLCWLINIALLGWGFNGINNYMSIFNIVLSILFLHHAVHQKNGVLYLVFSLLCGGLATFSFGNGILIWPIGLCSLYLWRAPRFFYAIFLVAAILFFSLYIVLPGGDAVGNALHLNGWKTLTFPVTLMGGPAYHLLRAWRVLPEGMLTPVATGIGVLVCLLTALALWQRLRYRKKNDALDAVAVALVLIGFGTTALLMLTRVEGVLDPAVDRFQIWALLVWLGISLLLYRGMTSTGRAGLRYFFLLFPLLALPAQLDWGARLAEYRTRVDNALLAYQVYLPVAVDAEKALHWNWQNKLRNLFPVLENLRTSQRNIFADGAAVWLGKPLPADSDKLPVCQWSVVRAEPLRAADLLDVAIFPAAQDYAVTATSADQTLGWRWYGNLDQPVWDFGLVADANGVVRGLLHPVRASMLPRANGLLRDDYNAYGIARLAQAATLLVMRSGEPVCVSPLQ